MSNIVNFKTNNKEQIFQEADYIRNNVSVFNENSADYKIERLVLGTSKVNGLYVGDDTVFVSFYKVGDEKYKDNGVVLTGKSQEDIDNLKLLAHQVFEKVKPILGKMTQSKILKFAPIIELETSKNFRKDLTREIYNTKTFFNDAPLQNSINVQKDFFTQQEIQSKIEKMKQRTAKPSLKMK